MAIASTVHFDDGAEISGPSNVLTKPPKLRPYACLSGERVAACLAACLIKLKSSALESLCARRRQNVRHAWWHRVEELGPGNARTRWMKSKLGQSKSTESDRKCFDKK